MSDMKITELTALLSDKIKVYSDYLESQGAPLPSHDISNSGHVALPENVAAAKTAAIEATQNLRDHLLSPTEYVFAASIDFTKLLSLHFIYRYRLAKLFPANEERSFEEIARQCELDEGDTRRLLRLAMTNHFFKEPRVGVVAHTAETKAIAENPLLTAWIGNQTEESWPSITRAYSLAHNIRKTPFEFMNKHPWRAKRFADAMSFANAAPDVNFEHFVQSFDFASLGQGTVVDVGGSHGTVAIAIAKRYPDIRCIVQDLPATIAEAPTDLPAGVGDRVSFMSHDFLTEQPVKGADIYQFRWIFHNWSDKYCVKILQALIPALKKGVKVVINDVCVPRPGEAPIVVERRIRGSDIIMKSFYNAKERDIDDWLLLFAKADARYRFGQPIKPPGSRLTILTAEWPE